MPMKKLVIIPAFNEESNIAGTVEAITEKAPDFDYVVINDCSTDGTRRICEENGYNVVNLTSNLGIGGAVQTGYKFALEYGYDVAVQMDGDGQHDPAYLAEMEDALVRFGADMVIGSRFIDKQGFQSSPMRRFGIRYFTVLIKLLTGQKITDPTSGMRMIGKRALRLYASDYPKDYPEPESVVMALRSGMKVTEVPVVMRERQGGTSSIGPLKSIYYMIKVTLAILIESVRTRRTVR